MYKLIWLLFLLAAAIITLSKGQEASLKMVMKDIRDKMHQCAEEEKATEEDINMIFNENKAPNSREGKCIIFCIHKRYKVQEEDGTLNPDAARATLKIFTSVDPNGKILEEAFENCPGIARDPDNCQYAADLGECLVRESRKLGLTHIIFE